MEISSIEVKKGLGPIRFGWKRAEVRAALGEPDEIENEGLEEGEEYQVEAWHYDEIGLSLQFDEEHDWRLITIAVSDNDYHLGGHFVIGMNRLELINVLDKLDFGELVFEDWSGEEGLNHHLVGCLEQNVNFWLEDDVVTEIQWGPEYDEDTEGVVWPLSININPN